jgi:hypothetical protein
MSTDAPPAWPWVCVSFAGVIYDDVAIQNQMVCECANGGSGLHAVYGMRLAMMCHESATIDCGEPMIFARVS